MPSAAEFMSDAVSKRRLLWPLVAVATVIAYLPALHGDLLWDDDAHVTASALRSLEGLGRIWFSLGATQQYYPVLHSAFWLEARLWGDSVLGYHLVTVAFHIGCACLFAELLSVLSRGEAPGGLSLFPVGAIAPSALLFALHPVCVESVAWISEQKNTLSLLFYLASALAYLSFDRTRSRGWYALALLLFCLALGSKSVTATLPAALGVILWWRRGALRWREDVLPLVPWLVVGIAGGLFTGWVEAVSIGAQGADFSLGAGERCLLAGRIILFYLGKLVWPSPLMFIYPRWSVDASAAWTYLPVLGVVAVTALAWAARGRTRGPLAGWLLFVGSLFPALGFVNVYPFIFSYVADHFQYLACPWMIALGCGAVASLSARLSAGGRKAMQRCVVSLVFLMGVLTSVQCATYRDAGTLYTATLRLNPDCWLAHLNLGNLLLASGKTDEALGHYLRAEALKPSYPSTHFNLGRLRLADGNLAEAIAEFRLALRYAPRDLEARNNLGIALAESARWSEAEAVLREATTLSPTYAKAHGNLGGVLAAEGRVPEAIDEYRRALALDPSLPQVHLNLAQALDAAGQPSEARREREAADRLRGSAQ